MEEELAGNAKKEKLEVLAPFASLEDLSPEQESPLDERYIPALPLIPEEHSKKNMSATNAPATNNNNNNNNNNNSLGISSTPRIDISRASSSSHQDDSSPERELFGEKSGDGSNGVKLGLGFSEEMAAELRSSTEELDFQDPNEIKRRRSTLQTQQAILFDGGERKDSACSVELGFLSISGRQSRISSVGSGGSAASAGSHYSAASHYSNASHLSAMSNLSKASRGSSPHRMLVETSFCGPKPLGGAPGKPSNLTKENVDTLNRAEPKHELQVKSNWVGRSHSAGSADTRARKAHKEEKEHRRHRSITPKIDDPKTQRFISLFSEDSVDNSAEAAHNAAQSTRPQFENSDLVKFVSLHGTSTDSTNGAPAPTPPTSQPTRAQTSQVSQAQIQPMAHIGHAGHKVTRPIPVPCPTVPSIQQKKEEFQKFSSEIKYMKPFTNKTLKDFISQDLENLSKPTAKHKAIEYDKSAKHLFISLKEDKVEKLPDFPSAENGSAAANIPSIGLEPASPPGDRKPTMEIDNKTQIFISLHEDPPGWKPPSSRQPSPSPHHISPQSSLHSRRSRTPEVNSATGSRRPSKERDRSRDSRDRSRDGRERGRGDSEPLVKIIPLHAGDDDEDEDSNRLRVINYAVGSEVRSLPSIPLYSLDIESHAKVYTLDLNNYADSRPARSLSQLRDVSRTPSPSNKSNFFRRNSESAKGCKAKSDSGSRSRKSSGVFGFFKRSNSIRSNKSTRSSRSPSIEPTPPPQQTNFNLKQSQTKRYDDTRDTIIIPLHSPDSVTAPVDITSATKTTAAEECDIRPASEFETPATTRQRRFSKSAESPGNDTLMSDDDVRGQQNITTTAEIVTHSEDKLEELKLTSTRISRTSSEDKSQGYGSAEPISEQRQAIVESVVQPTVASTSNDELKRFKRESMEKLQRVESAGPVEQSKPEVLDKPEVPDKPEIQVRPEVPVSEPDVRRTKRGKAEERRRRERSRSRRREESEHQKSSSRDSREDREVDGSRSSKDDGDEPKSKSSESGSEINLKLEETGDDIEKKGLMNQPDSLDDELPYVPTTLPQERCVGLPIIPVKQRAGDLVRTCPIERPRSTTPITPASLDMFVASSSPVTSPMPDKMLIVLPGVDLTSEKPRLRSPSQASSWQEFADQGFTSRRASSASTSPPPPLPPRMSTFHPNRPAPQSAPPVPPSPPVPPAPWVSFEEIAEKRRSPKKITTLPHRHMPATSGGSRSRSRNVSMNVNSSTAVTYNYVNPEDCSCECHDSHNHDTRVSVGKKDST